MKGPKRKETDPIEVASYDKAMIAKAKIFVRPGYVPWDYTTRKALFTCD